MMERIKLNMLTKKPFCIFLYVVIFSIFLNCAGQYPPPGGPIDTKPPRIVYTEPPQNMLYFTGNEILLIFDKYVDQRSVQEAVFVSPDLGQLEFDWSGKELKITFEEKLRENTTYILVVGTSAKDRRGNNLAETFSLSFSTGGSIDSCYIEGKVYSEKPEAIKIFAYKISDEFTDSVNIFTKKPDYLSQTSKDGSFSLKSLAPGKYRLFAIKDLYNNLLYDVQVDQYGTAQYDVILSESVLSEKNIKFKLSQEDTSKPFILSVQTLNNEQIKVTLSEPVKDSAYFVISEKSSEKKLFVNSYFLIKPNVYLLYTQKQDSVIYKLVAYGIYDTAGNQIIPEKNQIEFIGSNLTDTIPPTFEFKNILSNESNVPYDKYFLISFSEKIMQNSIVNGITLLDSAGNKIRADYFWIDNLNLRFVPKEKLTSKMNYTFKVVLDSLIDLVGNSIKDSVYILRFTTLDKNKLSSIAGSVMGNNLELNPNDVVVELFNLDKGKQKLRQTIPDQMGQFVFDEIPEGKYVIEAFIDKNKNLKYDCGSINPFSFSEFFTVYTDTINLRARWPIENVQIKF